MFLSEDSSSNVPERITNYAKQLKSNPNSFSSVLAFFLWKAVLCLQVHHAMETKSKHYLNIAKNNIAFFVFLLAFPNSVDVEYL